MRVVKKLEARFQQALEKMDVEVGNAGDAEEIAKLNAEIKQLKDEQNASATNHKELSIKNEKISQRNAELEAENKKLETSNESHVKELAQAKEDLSKSDADSKSTLAKVADLEAKLKQAQETVTASANSAKQVAVLETEVSALNSKLAETTNQSKEHFRRIRKLREALRLLRADAQTGEGNADNINLSIERELEVLNAQRQTDLEEVDAIIAKLTPLVEGN